MVSRTASANDRHFTFVTESATLAAGTAELEPWVTWRAGRDHYFNRFDTRLEFELGLADNLTAALYLNTVAATKFVEGAGRQTEFEFDGVSTELKYKVLDPVADAVGLAFYVELTGAPSEIEIEEKIILDKRIDSWLIAANLIAEQKVELRADENEMEYEIKVALAGAYFLSEHLTLGLEFVAATELEGDEYVSTAFSLGPNVSYATEKFWLSLTVLPQIGAIIRHESDVPSSDGFQDLEHHEMVKTRLLLGFHL